MNGAEQIGQQEPEKRGRAGFVATHRRTSLMSKSYQDIQKQIEALKREAEKLKRKEIEGVIDRIKEAIVTYELTAADLGLTGVRGKRGPGGKARGAKATRAKAGGAVKFRDAEGNTWGGRGPRPLWLREALAGGKQLQDFAV